MKRYQRIGVFVTGSPADDAALGFAGHLATLAKSKRVLCVYVHGGALEESIPVPETIDADKLRQHVLDVFPDALAPTVEVEVHEDGGIADILRSSRDQGLDLIVKGRLLPAHQAAVGSAFTKLARKSPCSVLIVPDFCRPHLNRFHVPVDFSGHSKLALLAALEIARASRSGGERAQVLVQTVYSVGYGYQKLGMDFEQAMAKQGQVTQKKLEEFLADVNTRGVEFETICTCSEEAAASVHELASARKMDMIVVGSRGLSPAAAAILGGTAERILVHAPQPVLIVKRKGETTSLLNALLEA